MVKNDQFNPRVVVAQPNRQFRMDLRQSQHQPFRSDYQDVSMMVAPRHIPSRVSHLNLHTHHRPMHPHFSPTPSIAPSIGCTTTTSSTVTANPASLMVISNRVVNPFADPPTNCSESDPRWVWRTRLEQARGHRNNQPFYASYRGNKNSVETASECTASAQRKGNYLKHLVKIGCPMHDLRPILIELGHDVAPAICNHKSHTCPPLSEDDDAAHLLTRVSLTDVGLEFKRNAFSTDPLHIEYGTIQTNLYVQRISNTNFNKAFRPGRYGTLHSLKKGSWKEGKIFYVFENDALVLNLTDNISIRFDLRSCVSNGDDASNTIDGWKNIVGGCGLYLPPSGSVAADRICSVLVLRKAPNFPIECIQNSTISVFVKHASNVPAPAGVLRIGSCSIELSRPPMMNPDLPPSPIHVLPLPTTALSSPQSSAESLTLQNYQEDDEAKHATNGNMLLPRSPRLFPMYLPESNPNMHLLEQFRMQYEERFVALQHQNDELQRRNEELNSLNVQLMHCNNGLLMHLLEQFRMQYEERFVALQHQNDDLQRRNEELNSLNVQLMHCNNGLLQERQQLVEQIQYGQSNSLVCNMHDHDAANLQLRMPNAFGSNDDCSFGQRSFPASTDVFQNFVFNADETCTPHAFNPVCESEF
eukprot:CAMPEP_0202726150 /NCGR_PEP_ID=MMETSP1385-20130828/184464_1 /ASSEMBLY_ACC=CAM_ASM_000861 /TAXON_ID=933848 /ORGANISM="Elphidium margaritaceum" /LENGTH=642 /DNA_ID=CAMNT_0049392363 /DNA_START=53 /DNA_END=1981 /DNA_ORIENTATION=+